EEEPGPLGEYDEHRPEREQREEREGRAVGECVSLDPEVDRLLQDRTPGRRFGLPATHDALPCNARSPRRPHHVAPRGLGLRSAPMLPLPTEGTVLGLPGRVVFGVLVLAAIAAFTYSISRRVRVLRAGRPDDRFTRIPERVLRTLEYAFAQRRMFRDPYAGFF